MTISDEPKRKVKFSLGQVVATPGALRAINAAGQHPLQFIVRHARGDWGELCEEDWQQNEVALRDGERLFSVYRTRLGMRIWVITEWDRSVTTLLRPQEY